MCSLKKYALIGVAALTAFTISCTDKDDDEPDGPKAPDGYTKSKDVTLGGKSNATKGSFLDADGSITVYLSADAPKNDIDLIFDGANVFVVSYYDLNSDALGASKLAGGKTAMLWKYTSSKETPQDIVDFLGEKVTAEDDGQANSAPKAGDKYVLFSTEEQAVYVKVKSVSADALEAWVGNFDF